MLLLYKKNNGTDRTITWHKQNNNMLAAGSPFVCAPCLCRQSAAANTESIGMSPVESSQVKRLKMLLFLFLSLFELCFVKKKASNTNLLE